MIMIMRITCNRLPSTHPKILFRASPEKRDFFPSIDNYVDSDWPTYLT